jgi:hypothetical protein
MSSASALASRPAAAAPLRASVARRARRAATSTRAVAVDPDAANNAVAAASSEPSSGDAAASLKKRLVAVAAASGRGLDATAAQKAAAASLIADLIAVNPTSDPAMSAKVNGDWELVYSDTFLFRSSPFFWAVGKMMGETGDFFYGAHDHQTGMFGGGVGRVVQSLDLDNNRIVSDCIVKASLGIPLLGFSPIFSGFGSVITAGRAVAESGARVAVVAETTTIRQDDTEVIPALNFLNNTTVPIEDAMRQLGGGAAPEVFLDILYVDDEMRVSKLEDGSTFVYQRC